MASARASARRGIDARDTGAVKRYYAPSPANLFAVDIGALPPNSKRDMRIIYFILVIVITAVLSVFAFENLESTTVSVFGWQVTAPLAALLVITYVLGMATGGSAVSFITHSLRKATAAKRPKGAPAPRAPRQDHSHS